MAQNSNSTTIKTGGTPTTLTQAPTTRVTANTVYQVTDPTQRVLDPTTALNVEVDATGGGSWVTAAVAAYTVDYMFGKVTFAVDQGGAALVRISGKYIPTLAVLEGVEFDVEDSVNLIESTPFGTNWRTRFAGLQEASGSFSVLALLQSDLDPGAGTVKIRTMMRAGTYFLLEYRPGGGVDYWRAWVLLHNGDEKAPLDSRIEGTVKFSTVAPLGAGENELAVPTWGQ